MRRIRKMSRRLQTVLGGLVVIVMLASGCAQATPALPTGAEPAQPEATAPPTTEAAATVAQVELPPVYQVPRPEAVDTAPPKRFRIAFLGYISNPAIAVTFSGCEAAKAELADLADVDCITVSEALDVEQMIAAMEDVITKEYDGALLLALNDGLNPVIEEAIAAGVNVATYLTEGENTWQTQRTFYLAQDLYGAGKTMGELMCEELGGQGKVGIITGYFGVTSHELRRMGFEDALGEKCPAVEIVGRFENLDKGDVAYTLTKDLLTANPDLGGVYVTAGGPFGAGQAILEEGLTDQVTVLSFDFVPETVELIKQGAIKATIGQDLWGQGHDSIIILYNFLVTGELPETYSATGNPALEHNFYPARSEIAFQDTVEAVAGKGELPWTPVK
jgi:ABC-type sugar transport system substrate-binding protein